MRRPARNGFVLPGVAILLALAALLVLDAVRGAALSQALSSATRLRQRAFEAAESGVARIQSALILDETVLETDAPDFETGVRLELVETLVPGFSANRVRALRYRAQSTGHAPRGTRITLEAGFTRLQSAP